MLLRPPSFSFFSLSANESLRLVKFWPIVVSVETRYYDLELTLGLTPRRTVLRSCNSISFCLILLTTSMSALSATYLRFNGLLVESAPLDREATEGRDAEPRSCGGVPGGVVDSAEKRLAPRTTLKGWAQVDSTGWQMHQLQLNT